jgi:hypothetical protein
MNVHVGRDISGKHGQLLLWCKVCIVTGEDIISFKGILVL